MSEFYEIDFLNVESKKSGDAISMRYRQDDKSYIHIVDGGFQATGEKLVSHLEQTYGNPRRIDDVVVTHSDGDHAGGLRSLFGRFEIGALWMLRPWLYAADLLPFFKRFTSPDGLSQRLRQLYPNLVELESLAMRTGTPILEPFQGARIGAFYVLAPSPRRYLDLILQSEKTPESTEISPTQTEPSGLLGALQSAAEFVTSKWGDERFSPEGTSAENEMSVVQYARIANRRILLTGDAGREGLGEAADFLEASGVSLPGIDVFQVPHHGSRRNVSTEVLDRLLGPRMLFAPSDSKFTAVFSASEQDRDHPKKAVVRACYHRGGGSKTYSNEDGDFCTSCQSPYFSQRGWSAAKPIPYPDQQES